MCELNRLKRIGLKALTVFILGLLFLALLPGKTLAEPAGGPGTDPGKPGTGQTGKPGTEPGKPGTALAKTIYIYLHEGSQGFGKATVEEIRAGKPVPGVVFQYWKFIKVPSGFDLNEADPERMNAQLNMTLDLIRSGKMPKENLDPDPAKALKTPASDADGKITVSGLTPGLYYFDQVRTKKPDGGKPLINIDPDQPAAKKTNFAPFLVVVTEDSSDQAIYPKAYETTELPGALLLKKVDDQDKPLAGVHFKLYDSQDQELSVYGKVAGTYDALESSDSASPVTDLVTDAKGQILVKNLPADTYYFKEIEAPPGFTPLSEKTDPIVVEPGEEASENTITVVNTRTYRFYKYDAKTDKPLKNAAFHLVVRGTLGRWKDYDNTKGTVEVQSGKDGAWTKAGNPVVVKSGADGWFAIRGLPKDTYGLKRGVKESAAPDGYKKDDRVYPFAVGLMDGTKVPNEPEESSSVSSEDSASSNSSSNSTSDSQNPPPGDRYDSENPPPWNSKNPPPKTRQRKKTILPPWVPQLPTGDPGFWTLVILGSGALIFLIVSKRRKKKEEEK